MSRRSHKAAFHNQQHRTEAREALERRWGGRLEFDQSLGWMVTGERNHLEPFHRWFHFKQSFAPELVRRFLKSAAPEGAPRSNLPLLDPFGGAGTLVVECGRRGVSATAVEAMPSLVFLADARMQPSYQELLDKPDWESWRTAAATMQHPLHRAALMLAVGQQHQSDGTPLAKPKPLPELFEQVCRMIREDLVKPLPTRNMTHQGDARALEMLEDNSVGGILTSPPYLSRHDYERVLKPYERVLALWSGGAGQSEDPPPQIAAHPAARLTKTAPMGLHPAVREAVDHLQIANLGKLPSVVASYFQDMDAVLGECGRVLASGREFWMVVGGTRLKDVYVPSDLILADMAERHGLQVTELCVARRLIDTGRKLGRLTNVSPRESIIRMVKPSSSIHLKDAATKESSTFHSPGEEPTSPYRLK